MVPGGGCEPCDNAPAAVATETLRVVVPCVTPAPHDKEPVAPMIETIQARPEGINRPERGAAAHVDAGEAAGIEPWIAGARDPHHRPVCARSEEPPAPAPAATPVARLARRRKTQVGRAADALRQQTVEPVFGIIASVMGFRPCLTRGLDNVQGEWTLVCLAWNLKPSRPPRYL